MADQEAQDDIHTKQSNSSIEHVFDTEKNEKKYG